jgi:exosortase/archaeosortase family protein
MGKKWSNLSPAIQFVIKSVLLVGIWRLLYSIFLKPIRFPDKVLTRFIGEGTILIINFLGKKNLPSVYCVENKSAGEVILIRGEHVILRIGDACNGLELMLIYVGVICLLPGNYKRKAAYVIIGLTLLLIANMLRCTGLEWVYEFYRPMFETTHHYIFTLVMYILIFIGWSFYINKGKFRTIIP